MAASLAKKALEIVRDENLMQNARELDTILEQLQNYINTSELVLQVRGKGLLNAIVINDSETGQMAWNICLRLRDKGLLAKPTHGNIIRFAPPLVITKEQLDSCIGIIIDTLASFEK